MKSIRVEKIDVFDAPIAHATVTFSSGSDRFMAFSDNCYFPEGMLFEGTGRFKLEIWGVFKRIKKVSDRPMGISIINSGFGQETHLVVGEVIAKTLLRVNDIEVESDSNFPSDFKIGDLMECEVVGLSVSDRSCALIEKVENVGNDSVRPIVELNDGNYKARAYCIFLPAKYWVVGEEVSEIEAIDLRDFKIGGDAPRFEQVGDTMFYHLCGRLFRRYKAAIVIGNYTIMFHTSYGGRVSAAKDGDYISMTASLIV